MNTEFLPVVTMVQQPSYQPSMSSEKAAPPPPYAHSQEGVCSHSHSCPHGTRSPNWRRFVLPLTLSTISLIIVLSLTAVLADVLGYGESMGLADLLMKRATDQGNGDNIFVDRKYYLIVLIVGIVLVIFLGLCLSAWCCRGAFENPLCCPCYLCACCGGLACLECIGCGLCAEAADV